MEQKHWKKIANLNAKHVAEDCKFSTGIYEVQVDEFLIRKKKNSL